MACPRYVIKDECANHVTKCLRSNLEKLVAENPLYKGKIHLTKSARFRIVSAVRGSIRFRFWELRDDKQTKNKAALLLRHDIKSCLLPYIWIPHKCSDFCRAKTTYAIEEPSDKAEQEQEAVNIFEEQASYWKKGSNVEAQEKSRLGTSIDFSDV